MLCVAKLPAEQSEELDAKEYVADVPNARLLWAKENPGHFHFTWECAC